MDILAESTRKLQKLCVSDFKKFKSTLFDELNNFYRPTDKIKIIESVLRFSKAESSKHIKVCQEPKTCSKSKNLALAEFILVQELEQLGINTGHEIFDLSEQKVIIGKLDDILKEIELLKMGHEIIYEDIKSEIDELRTMFFLSKKNWKQLLIGKFGEMTMSGIISESLSKKLLAILNDKVLLFISG
jgi:hypothetical protein